MYNTTKKKPRPTPIIAANHASCLAFAAKAEGNKRMELPITYIVIIMEN
jgi:hypothetical protein